MTCTKISKTCVFNDSKTWLQMLKDVHIKYIYLGDLNSTFWTHLESASLKVQCGATRLISYHMYLSIKGRALVSTCVTGVVAPELFEGHKA